ncbi:hypothetical protein LguiA_004034 [Lonicera macranthoides]
MYWIKANQNISLSLSPTLRLTPSFFLLSKQNKTLCPLTLFPWPPHIHLLHHYSWHHLLKTSYSNRSEDEKVKTKGQRLMKVSFMYLYL